MFGQLTNFLIISVYAYDNQKAIFRCLLPKEKRSRYFLWIPVVFGCGIGVYFSLSFEPASKEIYYLFFITLFVLLINCVEFKRYSITYMCVLCLGFCTAFHRTHTLGTHQIEDFVKEQVIFGTVLQVEDKEGHLRIVIDNVKFKTSSYEHFKDIKKIRTKLAKSLLKENQILPPGQQILVETSLIPFTGPIYPHGLDLRQRAYFEGISAQGSVKKILAMGQPSDTKIMLWLQKIRSILTQKITNALPKDTNGVGAALITGDRSHISQHVRQQYADAGIAHILAISGLHLSIIAGFIFLLLRGGLAFSAFLTEYYPIKKISAIIAILFTFLYLIISGCGYPVQRSFIMICLAMIAIIFDRTPLSMRTLAFAALGILIYAPEGLLSASFQLSFAAVVALIAFYESGWRGLFEWSRHGGFLRRSLAYVIGIVLSTLVATWATTPFTIFFFNRFTLQAIIGNVLAIPLTGIWVMPSALLAVISLLWSDHSFFFDIFGMGLSLLNHIAVFTAHLPGAAILIPSPPLWTLLMFVAGGLWFTLWQTRRRYIGVPLMCASFIGYIPQTPDILISKNTIAYQKGDVLHVSSSKGWFEQTFWQKHLGLSKTKPWDGHATFKSVAMIADPYSLNKKEIKEISQNKSFGLYLTIGYIPRFCERIINERGGMTLNRNDLKNGEIYGYFHKTRQLKRLNPTHGRPWEKRM